MHLEGDDVVGREKELRKVARWQAQCVLQSIVRRKHYAPKIEGKPHQLLFFRMCFFFLQNPINSYRVDFSLLVG